MQVSGKVGTQGSKTLKRFGILRTNHSTVSADQILLQELNATSISLHVYRLLSFICGTACQESLDFTMINALGQCAAVHIKFRQEQ